MNHTQTHQQRDWNMTKCRRMTLHYVRSLHECRYKSTSKISSIKTLQRQISLRGGQHKEKRERKRHLCGLQGAQHVLLCQTPIQRPMTGSYLQPEEIHLHSREQTHTRTGTHKHIYTLKFVYFLNVTVVFKRKDEGFFSISMLTRGGP